MRTLMERAALNTVNAPLFSLSPGEMRDGIQTALLAPRGEHPHKLGLQVVDGPALERLAAALNARRNDIVVDYDHATFSGAPAQRQAAGWIQPRTARVTEAGLVADIKWTANAAALITAGEYRYLSPVLLFDAKRAAGGRLTITGLFNAALTNNPNMDGMTPLSNEVDLEPMEEQMELGEIANLVGLPENAAANDVTAALTTRMGGLAALLNALGVEDVAAAQRRITELSAPPPVTPEDVATMRAELELGRRERAGRAVDAAIAEGKLTPAQRPWAENYAQNDAAGFAAWLANAPVVLPVKPSGAKTETPPANAALNETDLSVIRQLGISEEQFKAARGAA